MDIAVDGKKVLGDVINVPFATPFALSVLLPPEANHSEGQKMPSDTGGIQGYIGPLFGTPYKAGSWQD